MNKIFKLENQDCANCAAKMEREIAKIEGVSAVSVNFMGQRLAIEAEDSRFEEILERIVKVCKKVEPDCTIVR